MKQFFFLSALIIWAGFAQATDRQTEPVSPYAGQEDRAIKSLSSEDIAELRRGGGWGLAKAAELNGMPGPIHLLALKDEIPLEEAQVAAIEAVYARMKAQAIPAGEALIAAERRLEERFRDGTITSNRLRHALEDIARARRELRYIHLAAHLETPKLLSETQIARYHALRGYDRDDPCTTVPEGHDAARWRRHNGCD